MAGPGAGTPDGGAADSGTPDAGAPDSGAPDAGAPDSGTQDAGPSCNTLTMAGLPSVNLVTSTAGVPAQTGGNIADGMYALTGATLYGAGSNGSSGVIMQGVWVISGGVTHLEAIFPAVVSAPSDAGVTRATGLPGSASGTDTLTPPSNGAIAIAHVASCRGGYSISGSGNWAYSVTNGGQTLSFIPDSNHNFLATFTKQ